MTRKLLNDSLTWDEARLKLWQAVLPSKQELVEVTMEAEEVLQENQILGEEDGTITMQVVVKEEKVVTAEEEGPQMVDQADPPDQEDLVDREIRVDPEVLEVQADQVAQVDQEVQVDQEDQVDLEIPEDPEDPGAQGDQGALVTQMTKGIHVGEGKSHELTINRTGRDSKKVRM